MPDSPTRVREVESAFAKWASGPDGLVDADFTDIEFDGEESWCYRRDDGRRVELTDEWAAFRGGDRASVCGARRAVRAGREGPHCRRCPQTPRRRKLSRRCWSLPTLRTALERA